MFWRSTMVLLVLLAGCGSRSSLLAGSDADPSGGGAGSGSEVGGAGGSGGVGAGGSGGMGAGSGGEGGAPPALSIAELCVIAASCTSFETFEAPGYCVDAISRLGWSLGAGDFQADPVLVERLFSCAESWDGDCAAFRSCYGGDWITPQRCRLGGYCEGNHMKRIDGAGSSFDCGAIGATCQDLWSDAQRACCNAEPCPQSTEVECDGTVATYCGGWGEHVVFDCGESGRACQSDWQAPCAGTGDPCEPEAPVECEGAVATYCSGGHLATMDCAQTPHHTTCNQGEPSLYSPCGPTGAACGPWDISQTCFGSTLELCAGGEWVSIDCQDLGFSDCEHDGLVVRCVE